MGAPVFSLPRLFRPVAPLLLWLLPLLGGCGSLFAQAPGAQALPPGTSTTLRPFAGPQDAFINPLQQPFYHGVASGDPLPDRVIIWTRITPDSGFTGSLTVTYTVASDSGLQNVLTSGQYTTDASRDYTVKLDITGLQADTYYYFGFEHNGKRSVVGRTKTTPLGAVPNIRLGVVSCNDYRRGYFTAFGLLANRNDLDAVIHTGDYIYEGGGGPANRPHDPDFEIWRLQDYRQRYSLYRLDANLQRLHQVHPMIVIWDDHDIVVDALRDTSLRHDASQHGLYKDRKFAAIQAAREWLPMRDPDTTSESFFKNWRHQPFGSLLDLYSIDCRLYDRDRFATDTNDSLYGRADHKMLGPEQLGWLNASLRASQATWKVVNNGLMLAHFTALGRPLVLENWDGYPAERNQLFDNLDTNNIDNVLFVTGDFHCAFACDVPRNPYSTSQYNASTGQGSLLVEFIAPSASSDNFDEGNDFGLGSPVLASTLIRAGNPHIKYTNLTGHGYILLDLTPTRAQAEFYYTQNIQDPANRNESLGAVWTVDTAQNRLRQGSQASPPKTNVPPAPVPAPTSVQPGQQAPIVLSAWPNPSTTGTVWLNYIVMQTGQVQIDLLDGSGKTVRPLTAQTLAPGNYTLEVDTQNLTAGIYFLRVAQGTQAALFRLLVVKG